MLLLANASSQIKSIKVLKQRQKIQQGYNRYSSVLGSSFTSSSLWVAEKNMVTQKGLLEGHLQGKPKEQASEQVISFLKSPQLCCFHCIQHTTSVFVFCTISHCFFPSYQVYILTSNTELSWIFSLHKLKRLEVCISALCKYFCAMLYICYFGKTQI